MTAAARPLFRAITNQTRSLGRAAVVLEANVENLHAGVKWWPLGDVAGRGVERGQAAEDVGTDGEEESCTDRHYDPTHARPVSRPLSSMTNCLSAFSMYYSLSSSAQPVDRVSVGWPFS